MVLYFGKSKSKSGKKSLPIPPNLLEKQLHTSPKYLYQCAEV